MNNIWHDISPKRITCDRFYAVIPQTTVLFRVHMPTTATRSTFWFCAARPFCP